MRPRLNRVHRAVVAAAAGTLVLSVAACSTDDVKKGASDLTNSVTETAIRNAVASGGVRAFAEQGHNLQNGLACSAHKASSHWDVTCTGTTTGGAPAKMVANLDSGDGKLLRGSFIGTVDGKPVFESGCLGTSC